MDDKVHIALVRDMLKDQRQGLNSLEGKVDDLCDKLDYIVEKKIQPLHDLKNKIIGYAMAGGLASGFFGAGVEHLLEDKEQKVIIKKELFINKEERKEENGEI